MHRPRNVRGQSRTNSAAAWREDCERRGGLTQYMLCEPRPRPHPLMHPAVGRVAKWGNS